MNSRKMVDFLFLLLLLGLGIDLTVNGRETIEVESAIIRCQNPADSEDDDFRVVNWKPPPLTSFDIPIKPGPHDPNSALDMEVENDVDLNITRMTKCHSQAIITIKLIHNGNVDIDDIGTLIKIDHMLDERSGKAVRLGNPIAVKIQEGPVLATYPLKYLQTVNAKAKEEITKYSGTKSHEKCSGNICEYDENTNLKDPTLNNGFCCSCEDSVKGQLRGGHECKNMTKNDQFYSKHCFRRSDYWYAVFQIGPPEIFHQVYVEVYESVEQEDGTILWKPSGEKGITAKIDSLTVTNFEDGENLSISYRKAVSSLNQTADKLDSRQNFLLIPTLFYGSISNVGTKGENTKHHEIYHELDHLQSKPLANQHQLPVQLRNDIGNSVLVVPKKLVGHKCSQVGVISEVFNNQPSPCRETEGSCLRNQPFDLWDIDNNASGTVHYRLKNFGKVHEPAPFKRIQNKMYFVLDHESEAAAYIDIQQSADQMEVMRPGYNAQIVSVVSGCTSTGGKLIVEVANTEYVAGLFSVHVLSCTQQLPLQKSEQKLIDAVRMETFKLDIHFPPKVQLKHHATCSVGLINEYNEVVAFRTVVFSPGDTCICALNCKCGCGDQEKQACIPMSPDEIISAGFPNPEEFEVEGDEVEDLLSPKTFLALTILVAILLILLGLVKGIIGRFFRKVGKFGLGCIQNPLSWYEEIGLNAVFFLLLPVFLCCNCCCWCFRSKQTSESPALNKTPTSEKVGSAFPSKQTLKGQPSRTNPAQPNSSQRTVVSGARSSYGSWHKTPSIAQEQENDIEAPATAQEQQVDIQNPTDVADTPANPSSNPTAQFSGKWNAVESKQQSESVLGNTKPFSASSLDPLKSNSATRP